ncbi:hypothetical protein HII28_06410 [Planctomonas sp. JC2975]|uniref:hypothetical protein n=1 Tax=Planctomonas sp. JC2975 TaxID=2729626 RepID=UPI0014739D75|nr:hypothetical protein [Planctomonas sp. JC2975]NNC11511.1 hypothetical protein [Planctomonas sp. JC2975]
MRSRRWAAVTVLVLSGCLAGCTARAGLPMGGAYASSATPTPTATPTLDPTVSGELTRALADIRALPAVASATKAVTFSQSFILIKGKDGARPTPVEQHSFHASFAVAMSADATARQTAAVTRTLARDVGWTGIDLAIETPATNGRIATRQNWTGTFDGNVDQDNSLGVSQGLFVLATTPGVQSLSVSIPYTGRIDYGQLTIDVSPNDDATLAAVKAVVKTTEFRDITLHGSFANGAKP